MQSLYHRLSVLVALVIRRMYCRMCLSTQQYEIASVQPFAWRVLQCLDVMHYITGNQSALLAHYKLISSTRSCYDYLPHVLPLYRVIEVIRLAIPVLPVVCFMPISLARAGSALRYLSPADSTNTGQHSTTTNRKEQCSCCLRLH